MTTARLLSSLLLAAVATSSPPPAGDKVAMARYVVHYTDWASIATISTREGIEGFPFSNLRTIADGVEPERSTGVPYYYTSDLDMFIVEEVVCQKFGVAQALYHRVHEARVPNVSQ